MGSVAARAGARDRRLEPSAAGRATACVPHLTVAPDATTIRTLLRRADAGTRERLATTLQRLHGNAALQQALAPAAGLPVQRWAVGLLRSTTDCERIVGYMNSSSPYADTSGWAQTTARFRRHGSPSYSETDGVITATVANPRVTRSVDVDMPQWAPTDPAIRDAWSTTMAALRAHEARHEAIAEEWETTLLGRLSSLTVTVPDRSDESFQAAVQAEWSTWISEHQDRQWDIDPYYAEFWCPTPIEEPEPEAPAE